MALWERFHKWWKKENTENFVSEALSPPKPEQIRDLPTVDDDTFSKESRKYLQKLDELITISEAEIEALNFEQDKLIKHQFFIKEKIENNKDSWLERTLLLQLERVEIHRKNIQQRLEIYNQNIRVYLNLISRIQDVQAMRMGEIDENKISSVWFEFKESLEQYRERLKTEEMLKADCSPITTDALEKNIESLKQSIFGIEVKENPPKEIVKESQPIKKEMTLE